MIYLSVDLEWSIDVNITKSKFPKNIDIIYIIFNPELSQLMQIFEAYSFEKLPFLVILYKSHS
jgi:hypothetical protein